MVEKDLLHSPLGKASSYSMKYDPSLLFPIFRKLKRDEIQVGDPLPFQGVDIWNAYELSWLNKKGKPVIALATFFVPCSSPYIFESKSLKLYLNSFNHSNFESVHDVKAVMKKDLSRVIEAPVEIQMILPEQFKTIPPLAELSGECIDHLDIEDCVYRWDPDLLRVGNEVVEETLVSHLLRSNCLVTEQPDWGSVSISYQGAQINRQGLLKYIISFRNHYEFHEQCIERIYMDIWRRCKPEKLSVYARYTRRGGIDINPFRSSFMDRTPNIRHFRQ